MNFKQLVMGRYAAKSFDGRKISQDKIDELFELIRHAPSSWNLQPWKVKVVTEEETKRKLAPASWNQPQVTSCSHLLVFCADSDILALIEKLEKLMLASGVVVDVVKNL